MKMMMTLEENQDEQGEEEPSYNKNERTKMKDMLEALSVFIILDKHMYIASYTWTREYFLEQGEEERVLIMRQKDD